MHKSGPASRREKGPARKGEARVGSELHEQPEASDRKEKSPRRRGVSRAGVGLRPPRLRARDLSTAKRQDTSENTNYEVNPTQPKTDSSDCFGITRSFRLFVYSGSKALNHDVYSCLFM
jgi:hypothetical protein